MEERNLRKTRVGTVVSNKMDKTVVVAVKDNVRHPLYKKILKRTVTFKAHDEEQRMRYWRQGTGYGDTPAVQGQTLESCRNNREGKIVFITGYLAKVF